MDDHSPITVCLLGFTLSSICGVLGLMSSVRSQTAVTLELTFRPGIELKFFLFSSNFPSALSLFKRLSLFVPKTYKNPSKSSPDSDHNSANVLCFSIKSIPESPSKPNPSFTSKEARILHCI